MPKLKLIVVSVLLATALVVSMGIASSGATPPHAAQAILDAPAEDIAVTAAPAVTPLAGLSAVSPSEPWVTEVRIPVIIENVTADTMAADLSTLGDMRFFVRDSASALHAVDSTHPQRGTLPNHSLRYLDPTMTSRWTLGFRVPTATATNLTLELRRGDEVVTSWKVDQLSDAPDARDASAAATRTVTIGQSFGWDVDIAATATQVGSLVCGDPNIETVTQVVAVAFTVTNEGMDEVRWPGYIHRDGASVAQWADGTAAEMKVETFVGEAETLPRVSTFAVRMPPMVESTRALVFAAPRDGRFTNTETLPAGVLLHTGADDVWLDLSGATSTLAMSPAFCDLGFFGGPVPFGFSPGAKYHVGGEAPAVDIATLDSAAQMMITEALAGAALHYDSHGQSFGGVSGSDLVAAAPRLSFVGHDVGADLGDGQLGVVYFATRKNDDQFIFVTTRSASGRWFCAGISPHTAAIAADGLDLDEISDVCNPETLVDEG